MKTVVLTAELTTHSDRLLRLMTWHAADS